MEEIFSYGKRYYYPHMKPADVAIWERFIETTPDAFDNVQYDLAVGTGSQFDPTVDDSNGADIYKLYQKKIDVVAFKKDKVYIVELKPRAGASAVGQVKMYKKLYTQDYAPPEEPICVIITDEETADLKMFAQSEGVIVVVV